MDSSDDFEFKPLTEGLGFHKKAEKIKSDIKSTRLDQDLAQPRSSLSTLTVETENGLLGRENSRPASKSISDLIASLPPSLDFIADTPAEKLTKPLPQIEANLELPEGPRPQIFQPFAREDFKASAKPLHASLSATLPTPGSKATMATTPSPHREKLAQSLERAFPQPGRANQRSQARQADRQAAVAAPLTKDGLQPIPVHFGAGILDAMVVTGMSAILLVAIVAITQVNLWGLMSNARTDSSTQVHIALLFTACLQLYLLTARSFFGASLGEWAFDLQLGTDQQQLETYYPLQVAWRSLVVTLTGFILLPLLSALVRRDLARYVTGLQLYLRKV